MAAEASRNSYDAHIRKQQKAREARQQASGGFMKLPPIKRKSEQSFRNDMTVTEMASSEVSEDDWKEPEPQQRTANVLTPPDSEEDTTLVRYQVPGRAEPQPHRSASHIPAPEKSFAKPRTSQSERIHTRTEMREKIVNRTRYLSALLELQEKQLMTSVENGDQLVQWRDTVDDDDELDRLNIAKTYGLRSEPLRRVILSPSTASGAKLILQFETISIDDQISRSMIEDVKIDTTGLIYVTDGKNCKLKTFDRYGTIQTSFSAKRYGKPQYISMNPSKDEIAITLKNSKDILIYNPQEGKVTSVLKTSLGGVGPIAFSDKAGQLFAGDVDDSNLHIYSTNGNLVQRLTDSNIRKSQYLLMLTGGQEELEKSATFEKNGDEAAKLGQGEEEEVGAEAEESVDIEESAEEQESAELVENEESDEIEEPAVMEDVRAVPSFDLAVVMSTAAAVLFLDRQNRIVSRWPDANKDYIQLKNARGICLSPWGTIFVTDTGHNCVHEVTQEGHYKRTILDSLQELNQPVAIDFSADGLLLVAEHGGTCKFFDLDSKSA